jgi:hypothetical protein
MDRVFDAYTERLFSLGRNLFATILRRDSNDVAMWKHRTETFNRHGLLSFLEESPFWKPRELHVDQSRLEDVRYRRSLVRKLKAPHPGKWTRITLRIDRERLLNGDEKYLAEMAAILSYKWALKLTPVVDPADALALPHLDVDTLTHCLDKMGNHQSDAKGVASVVMRAMAERLVDENPRFQATMAEMRAAFAQIRADIEPVIKAVCDEVREEAAARFSEIAAETSAKFDSLSEASRKDFAAQKARSEAVLDENKPSGLTPEEEFRQAVKRREAEHREANRLSPRAKRWLWGLGSALFGAGAYFVEVNGTTLVEVLF